MAKKQLNFTALLQYILYLSLFLRQSQLDPNAPMPDGISKEQQAVVYESAVIWELSTMLECFGFQDTLCDVKGFYFFKTCFIKYTVDFIFGRKNSFI